MTPEQKELPKQPTIAQRAITHYGPPLALVVGVLAGILIPGLGLGLVGVLVSCAISLYTVGRGWFPKNFWTWEANWILAALCAYDLGRRVFA